MMASVWLEGTLYIREREHGMNRVGLEMDAEKHPLNHTVASFCSGVNLVYGGAIGGIFERLVVL